MSRQRYDSYAEFTVSSSRVSSIDDDFGIWNSYIRRTTGSEDSDPESSTLNSQDSDDSDIDFRVCRYVDSKDSEHDVCIRSSQFCGDTESTFNISWPLKSDDFDTQIYTVSYPGSYHNYFFKNSHYLLSKNSDYQNYIYQAPINTPNNIDNTIINMSRNTGNNPLISTYSNRLGLSEDINIDTSNLTMIDNGNEASMITQPLNQYSHPVDANITRITNDTPIQNVHQHINKPNISQ
ncbi:hypothetical protein RF11_00338 [Thelohanellus kitauei]|uniref:Uncharacterized protein n=1 Tax=Thelohanellus kitauei TaxID=669202 RepID=A0A0C2N1J8_THEKT|nr:hypothetical protein RF11_00338 [Thelohanellus kitauei]